MEVISKLPLPLGSTDYKEICKNYYYIDKTLLIKELLDERAAISLFTRPRRFGKTLNMNMLKTFFEKSAEDTSVYFKDKKIWQQGEKYTQYQGKYPVIFLSFKDANKYTWAELYPRLIETIRDEYIRHSELKNSNKISDPDFYKKIVSGNADTTDYAMSILRLSQMLREHYGEHVVLIIDEYDTPIQAGYIHGYYKEVIQFARDILSSALKDNYNLAYGILTGILRVAKESIFSGLNNVRVYSVLDRKFSTHFGFTAAEVAEIARYYEAAEKLDEVRDWYDGYKFGPTEIYNPWSVLNYFSNDCQPQPYWLQTSSNSIIYEMLDNIQEDTYESLRQVIDGGKVTSLVYTNVIYPELGDRVENIFSLLLMAGYLKAVKTTLTPFGDTECELCIPNRELKNVYYREIIAHLSQSMSINVAYAITKAMLAKDDKALKVALNKFLREAVSYYDTLNENYYHGLLLGIAVIFSEHYFIRSNRESGKGRYDIALEPKKHNLPGIIVEVKAKGDSDEALDKLAQSALQQIEEKQYDTEMKSRGITKIYKYGIAFHKKQTEIITN